MPQRFRLDLRQHASRHTETLSAITRELGLGSYDDWSEADRQAFLLRELQGRRPLVPPDLGASREVREVLDTFRVAARLPPESLSPEMERKLLDAFRGWREGRSR